MREIDFFYGDESELLSKLSLISYIYEIEALYFKIDSLYFKSIDPFTLFTFLDVKDAKIGKDGLSSSQNVIEFGESEILFS